MSTDRDNVRALFRVLGIDSRMGDSGWEKRLKEALAKDRRSYSAISKAAGLSRNFVSQMFTDEKAPSIDNFAAICRVLGVSPIYIWTGAPMTPEMEILLERWAQLAPDRKVAILALMDTMRDDPQEG